MIGWEIGFWILLSIISTLFFCMLTADDSFRAGYRRGYIDGGNKVRPAEPRP